MTTTRYFTRPTYWACKQILNRLEDFRNLLFYYCPYAGYEEKASKPLSQYVDGTLPHYRQVDQLKEKISNHVELVGRALKRAGIPTIIERWSSDADKKETIDVFLNIFGYLKSDRGTAEPYNVLLDLVNRGIGIYEARRKAEKRSFWNPLHWIGLLLKLPLSIIVEADLVSDEEARRTLFKIYARIIEILMLIILLLVADKLGVRSLIGSLRELF